MRLRSATLNWLFLLLLCTSPAVVSFAADLDDLIDQIRAVDAKGEGHREAVKAAQELQQLDQSAVLPLLNALDGANPLAMNWLQVSFESLADRLQKSGQLDAAELEKFVLDRTHHGRARKLAFDWLEKVDESARERLIPGMLDDPSSSLRREAVIVAIRDAEQAADEAVQIALWKKALAGAVDRDQVDQIAGALKKLGESVDIVDHFGLLTEWSVIGPFDNRNESGFHVVYPPEKEIDLQAEYEGMSGKVKWERLVSERKDGEFDIAELTAPHKGAIDYAYTEFNSPTGQAVEFRLATANAWKLWVNGELVFAREEYHRGMQFDQYIVRGRIEQGKNTFLLKVCQNEQDQDWAQRWAFSFRIVDESGRAVTQAD